MDVLEQFEYLKIKLEAIKSATNDFAEEQLIGKGGFGKVYKGELVHSYGHTTVAIKRLDRKLGQGDSEFWKEVLMLSAHKHENIVSLLGFCDEKGEKILVYEYASQKSLDLHLDNEDLTWIRRLKICLGAAHGLAYLHDPAGTQQRILHRDIKSSNILLDENWNARISDLGLSKYGPANQLNTFVVSTNIAGTLGYCDPLYISSGILTKESDVYSFGVVLFEVLCGRLCFGSNDRPQSFARLVRKHYKNNTLDEVIWGNINHQIHPSSLKAFSSIAYQCLKNKYRKRPIMNEIVTQLEIALQCQLSTASVSIRTHQDKAEPGFFQNLKEKFNDFNLGEKVRRLKTHGVDEKKNLVLYVPKDLRRHICFNFVKKVPLFKDMNERFLDDICARLKPHLFKRKTYITQEGDPVYAMLFIIHGRIECTSTNRWRIRFLEEGDFSGEELLYWALDNNISANLPSSTNTLKALKEVKAFALSADELKSVINQYSRHQNKRVKHIFTFYSPQWQHWAACFIQMAWRRYSDRMIWERQRKEEHNNNIVGGAVSFATYHNQNDKFDTEMLKSLKPHQAPYKFTSDSD